MTEYWYYVENPRNLFCFSCSACNRLVRSDGRAIRVAPDYPRKRGLCARCSQRHNLFEQIHCCLCKVGLPAYGSNVAQMVYCPECYDSILKLCKEQEFTAVEFAITGVDQEEDSGLRLSFTRTRDEDMQLLSNLYKRG